MRQIKLFTILFFCISMFYAQENQSSKSIENDAINKVSKRKKGGVILMGNTLGFSPTNQTIEASSGANAVATVSINYTGDLPESCNYNINLWNAPDNGFQTFTNNQASMNVDDAIIEATFTFNLDVNTPTTSTYAFRADYWIGTGDMQTKYINITVNYSNDPNQDTDGDGVIDSEDDCPNEAGPASNDGCPLPQSTCNLPAPTGLNVITVSSNDVLLNWNAVQGDVNSYRIKIGESPNFPNFIWATGSLNTSSFFYNSASPLQPNTEYFWTVEARCENNSYGEQSSPNYFTTGPECNINPPSNIDISGIDGTTADVCWQNVSGSNGYQLQLLEGDDISASSHHWVNVGFGCTSLGNLLPETTYSVRVRSKCSNNSYGDWEFATFTTTCSTSAPQTITISSTNPIYTSINWSSVNGSFGYHSQYKQVSANNWVTISEDNLGNGFSITGLVPSSSYIARVRSKCESGFYGPWKYETFISSSRIAQVDIFPNPAKSKINLNTKNTIKSIEVVNSFGITISKNNNSNKEININNLPFGIYYIKIELQNGEQIIKRFVKN